MKYDGVYYNLEKNLNNGTFIYVSEDGKSALIVDTLMNVLALIKAWCAENEAFIELEPDK